MARQEVPPASSHPGFGSSFTLYSPAATAFIAARPLPSDRLRFIVRLPVQIRVDFDWRALFGGLRGLLAALALTITATIVGTILYFQLFGPGSAPAGECDNPDLSINYPQDRQEVTGVVEIRGTFDCLPMPEDQTFWIIVTPPIGSPHGVHRPSVISQGKTFSATVVLGSGPGNYEVCAVLANKAATQTFEGAILQDPPVGIVSFPVGALRMDCKDLVLP